MKKIIQWWNKFSTTNLLNNDISFSYIVKYPVGHSHSERLPMLIALHGDGDTVDNFYESALDQFKTKVRIILIKAPISHECGNVWPFSAAQYKKYSKAFSEAVDQLAIKYPTNNKPILLGFSGGGAMAYHQAATQGQSYAYIFPISGLLLNEQLHGFSPNPGAMVFSYHGKKDEVVAFSAGKNAIKLLKSSGIKVNFTAFNSGHHGIFNDMKTEITQVIEEKLYSL